jgi:hypothetical protein
MKSWRNRHSVRERSCSLLLLILLIITSGSARSSRLVEPPHVPDISLRVTDNIEAPDFLIDDDGAIHVVWVQSIATGGRSDPYRRLFCYKRGDDLGRRWSRTIVLDSAFGPPPRIFRMGSALHTILGYRLEHLVSQDHGLTWIKRQPLLAVNVEAAQAFDILPEDNTFLVTYLSFPQSAKQGGGSALFALRSGVGSDARLAGIGVLPNGPHFRAPPRIVRLGTRISVLSGATERQSRARPYHGQTTESVRVRGYVSQFHSENGGASWAVAPPISLGGLGASPSPNDLEITATRDGAVAYVDASRLYCVKWNNGTWGPSHVCPEAYVAPGSQRPARTIAAAAIAGKTCVAWIDYRNQRHDSTWLSGGGEQEWANNDVYCADVDPDAKEWTFQGVRRLTRSDSYASSVRMQSFRRFVVIMWAGRDSVGRSLFDGKATPKLYYVVSGSTPAPSQ